MIKSDIEAPEEIIKLSDCIFFNCLPPISHVHSLGVADQCGESFAGMIFAIITLIPSSVVISFN